MALKYNAVTTVQGLRFLRHCYSFVNTTWQSAPRTDLPDQGFELNFRSSCALGLDEWLISQKTEIGLGDDLETTSGIRHDIDLTARNSNTLAITELKNRSDCPPSKDDVIVFFAKILDYLANNPKMMLGEIVPVFISTCAFEESTLATCLGLGIHPIAPGLRPLPVLADNLKRTETAIKEGFALQDDDLSGQWDDICADINRLVLGLDQTWFSARCGYVSDDVINFHRIFDIESIRMSRDLRQLNGNWSDIHASILKIKNMQQ
ncbi:MAG TPA: hypothetical protein VGO57_04895 [Verrucomicrobiae bacterium]